MHRLENQLFIFLEWGKKIYPYDLVSNYLSFALNISIEKGKCKEKNMRKALETTLNCINFVVLNLHIVHLWMALENYLALFEVDTYLSSQAHRSGSSGTRWQKRSQSGTARQPPASGTCAQRRAWGQSETRPFDSAWMLTPHRNPRHPHQGSSSLSGYLLPHWEKCEYFWPH